MNTRIGYVGLGRMGGALAGRLLKSLALDVYDLDPVGVARLASLGARPQAGLDQLGRACDLVLMCLPTSDHVRQAVFGPRGLLEGLSPGALLVDQSTGDPQATRAMATELAARGIGLVDAPVSGGVQGAEAGTIAIMLGAGPLERDRVEPVLRAISPNVFHAGGVGAGHVIKLVNNLISGAQRLLTMEGVALAAKNGIDPQRACNILMAGGARNVFLEKFMGPQILHGRLDVAFTLGLMHKDVRLACELGSASGVPLPFGNTAREFYRQCIDAMGEHAQVHTAALVYDRLAGTQVVPAVPAAETRPGA